MRKRMLTGVFIFLIPVLALLPSRQANDQKFEGSLQVIKISLYDTTFLIYKIKDESIKIEEYDNNANHLRTYLVNLKDGKVYAIDPVNKLYKPLQLKPFIPIKNQKFEVIKSENFMYLNGYKCNQWRIKNKEDNTEIAYWVTKDDFGFYTKLLEVLNSFEKTYNYFLYIPDNQGYIPMMTVERTLVRDEKLKVEIQHIEREFLDSVHFKIPDNYRLYN